jgi:NADPH2:quinone reductase
MKAAFIKRTGSPDTIVVGDLSPPCLGPRDVLIRVKKCSVNPIDTYVRAGLVAMPLTFPFVVGSDFAGDILATGCDVDGFRPGMKVWGSNQGLLGRPGCFAENIAVHERWVYPKPEGVSYETASAAALVSMTACLGLLHHACIAEGETIFVNGGSGAVGIAVVQIAKALGARVIASAGTPKKRKMVEDYGADVVVDYHDPAQVLKSVRQFAPHGVDVFWETSREPDFHMAISIICERGRIVLMAGRDAQPSFPVGPFYVKQCQVHGFVMFKSSSEEQLAAALNINRWLSSGALRMPVDRVLPLSSTAEAHRLQEASTVHQSQQLHGKIIIDCD